MESEFVIQVVHKATGEIVEWAPGQAVEKDFEVELANRVRSKGIGLLRGENHVIDDVRAALRELIYDLKKQVP